MVLAPPRALTPTLTRALTRPRRELTTAGTFTYLRPDGTSSIFRPDGTSIYTRP